MTGDVTSDDVAIIRGRIPSYRGYDDESARHDTDMRVRAILGESLTDAHARLGLDASAQSAYDKVLARCMFGEQTFVKKLEHAALGAKTVAALVAADRELVELEDRINDAATSAELVALISEVDAKLTSRSDILPDAKKAR